MIQKFEVGKWYRYLGKNVWVLGSLQARVLDKKPRQCVAVAKKGKFVGLSNMPKNRKQKDGLWSYGDNLEGWQEIPASVIDDILIFDCPICGKKPIVTDTGDVGTFSLKRTARKQTYSCCTLFTSGEYPTASEAWNQAVLRVYDNKLEIEDFALFLKQEIELMEDKEIKMRWTKQLGKVNTYLRAHYSTGDIYGNKQKVLQR